MNNEKDVDQLAKEYADREYCTEPNENKYLILIGKESLATHFKAGYESRNSEIEQLKTWNEKLEKILNNLEPANDFKIGDRVFLTKTPIITEKEAWAFHNDKDIINEIDHINGIKSDNRIINLRHVSHRRNSQNQKRHRDGKLFGATYSKFHKKWMSRIRIGKKTKYLGFYNTELEAHNRYIQELNKIDLL